MQDGVVEKELLQSHYEQQKRRRAQQDWCEQYSEGNHRRRDSAVTDASIIEIAHQPEEPLIRANNGASDQHARERMWRHAQRQTNQNGKARIPLHLNISEAQDIESQVALR